MPSFDASNAECHVFTYKDGLLSAVAHDLKIRVTDFKIDVEDDDVRGEFDARSLRVVNAMAGGKETGALGDGDKKKIEELIVKEVLHADKHPKIGFEMQAIREKGEGHQIKGTLDLHGTKKDLVVDVRPEEDRFVVDAKLHQPDFGVKPFSAMMGTLKIKPDVEVRISVPRW